MRLSFMVLDIDVDAAYSGKCVDGGAPVADDTACVWGTTPAGESVCAVVDPTSFFTYFYIPAPDKCGDAPFAAEVRGWAAWGATPRHGDRRKRHMWVLCGVCSTAAPFPPRYVQPWQRRRALLPWLPLLWMQSWSTTHH